MAEQGHHFEQIISKDNARTHLGNNITNIYHGTQSLPKPSHAYLQSLAFLEMYNRFNDIDTAAKGTCDWLLQHKTYTIWAACNRGLLWIKGKPGSGKSTILRHAFSHIKEAPNVGHKPLILSFFFHGRGAELQRTPLGLFRSLLHQILDLFPYVLPDFVTTFQERCDKVGEPGEKWHWHLQELQHFFKSALAKVLASCPVWLFVDALDECGKESAIELVKGFKTLLQELPSTGLQFCICFTCRHYPILDRDSPFEICLEHENEQDIATYIGARLSQFYIQTGSTIPALITERANGVFMWARLVVDKVLELDLEGEGLKVIEKEISTTPQDLDELYLILLRTMDKRPASLKLIQWICFAMRPLSLDELRWAMAVDTDYQYQSLHQYQSTEEYISDNIRMKRRVQTLSCGFAEITPSSDTQIVQFIHQSVKDFFVEKGLSALHVSLKTKEAEADFVGIAHYRLSRTCIRYLVMEEIAQLTTRNRDDLISKFPLLQYATTSCLEHAEQSEIRKVSQNDLLDYFRWPSKAFTQLWVQIYSIIDQFSDNCPPRGTTMVHMLARFQLIGPLQVILQNADQVSNTIGAKDERGQTPLSRAAKEGHEAIVKLLLEHGANIESEDEWGQTSLSMAAEEGHEAIVKLLLEHGANIESKDERGRTPLSWAAIREHEATVKLLLEQGANIESKDEGGQTSLSRVAEKGHKAIVKLLLKHGANIKSKDKWGRTPLSWAAEEGHEAIVKLLLEQGANIESKDEGGQTPLSWAAMGKHEATVKLLLEKGVEKR